VTEVRCWPGLPPGSPEIEIPDAFLAALEDFGERSARRGREAGAFILGKARGTAEGWWVRLEQLEEIAGDGDAETFTFPAEAFIRAHQHWRTWSADEVRASPDALHVVGWCHTHPGHGVFLSQPDLEVHHRKFPLPFQVALVLDPLAIDADRRMGLVAWTGEEMLSPHLPGTIATFAARPAKVPAPRKIRWSNGAWPWGVLPLIGALGWWLWHHGF
jgi:proteasome lid subunit RPN8/RPN11